MKKFLALLLTVAMVFAMAACSAPAADETKPAEEGTAAPAEETSEQPAASGSVYYLNFKPESDAAWQEIAKTYTEQTGVPVTVVTPTSSIFGSLASMASATPSSNISTMSVSSRTFSFPTAQKPCAGKQRRAIRTRGTQRARILFIYFTSPVSPRQT